MNDISIYIHYPFCVSKCPYCDFNSFVSDEFTKDEKSSKLWIECYKKEFEYLFNTFVSEKRTLKTVFFGGGTPSLMSVELCAEIINFIKTNKNITVADDLEVTLEANPNSVDVAKFDGFKNAGVNRISIGVQSFNESDLITLGRKHSKNEAIKAIEVTRSLFCNYSIDLIYARHNQTLTQWEQELKFAFDNFIQNHASLYSLTIEKGTKYYKMHKDGKIIVPEGDLSFEFYNITNQITQSYGLNRYETSNYSKKGLECKHNKCYWTSGDYLGIGPGAHSRLTKDKKRYAIKTVYNPKNWTSEVLQKGNGVWEALCLSDQEIAYESLIMGLRNFDGISTESIKQRFNIDLFEFLNKKNLNLLSGSGLICKRSLNDGVIKATTLGHNVLDGIIQKISI